MKTFSFPVSFTTTGWIEINAESLEAAKAEAKLLNENGFEYFDIHDSEDSCEVMVDDGTEIG